MKVQELYDLLNNKILILDGATGTELQKRGMPKGICPEKWVCDNPDVLIEIQQKYKESGSDIIYSCTFGANRYKLEEFGLDNEVYRLNKNLAEISKKAIGKNGFVAGDIAPTGKFIEPFGDVPFEEAVNVYKEQVKGLLDGGVDLFVIETMIDIQEMRAAVIAVKELCDLPVAASMTFSEDGYTLTGTDPVTALITLQSLGADVVGCNCSTGPDKMLEVIRLIKPYSKVPLIAKPNAGLPKLIDGNTVFDMNSDDFSKYVPDFLKAGVNLFGGCCGTSFDYIKKSSIKAKGFKPMPPQIESISALSSTRKHIIPGIGKPLSIVGERINPTGKKKLQSELKDNKFDEVKRFALEQTISGASILDVNMGMSGINEKEMMLKTIKLLSTTSELPLCIDSSDPDVIEAAIRIYPGRALINSISGEIKKKDKLLKIAAKYGAMFILLPLNDKEIPKSADGRIKIINEIYEESSKLGFTKNDIVIDGLVMTVSSDQEAAKETLKLINWCSNTFKVNTILGLSNVSFGLPQRKNINASFLSMAIANGLSMAIANPSDETLMNAKYASDVLIGNDFESKTYINKYSQYQEIKKEKKGNIILSPEQRAHDCIIDGNRDNIIELIKTSLANGTTPNDLVDNYLIKAINKVGDLYDKKIYFLPQLIASADTMKTAFSHIEPLLKASPSNDIKQKPVIILATVKGDIHDIGKNIVALMMKNYGFEVTDLGKDVPSETIVNKAIEKNADIIGLSALMTTTMTEMKNVIDLAKEKRIRSKIIIGGAVINQQYADEIKADGYAYDSIEAVKLVKELLKIK